MLLTFKNVYQEEIDDSHEVAPLGLGEVDENEAAL